MVNDVSSDTSSGGSDLDESSTRAAIEEIFASGGVSGSLHARPVDRKDLEVAVNADEPVVLASVFKITVALAFARGVVSGRIDPRRRAIVGERYRLGGIGTGGCQDDVDMSLRDLAALMMTQSDNAATDVVLRHVGLDAVHEVLRNLDLEHTVIDGGCEDLFRTMLDDLDLAWTGGVDQLQAAIDAHGVGGLRAMDPRRSCHRSTPRDMTTQLSKIWTDTGSHPQACKIVRDIMAEQVWTHRLMSGFSDGITVAGKTGTLSGVVRNEVGVIGYPDGRHYAVAVFLRDLTRSDRRPDADRAIGVAAHLAVESLRCVESRTIVAVSHAENVGERT